MYERVDRQERSPAPPARDRSRAVVRRAGRAAVPTTSEVTPIGPEGGPLDRELASRIQASRGSPIETGLRSSMERSFGADFSAVRIHRSDVAPALSAQAFTLGSDVHFAPGEYRPSTTGGQELLAHELSHVVQQTGGVARRAGGRIRRALYVGTAGDAAEREAGLIARQVMGRLSRPAADDQDLVDDGVGGPAPVIRRRIDTGALADALHATTDTGGAYHEVAEKLTAPRNSVIDRLDQADPRRQGYDDNLDPLFDAVFTGIAKVPYNTRNIVPPAKRAAMRLNDIESEITIRDAGLPGITDPRTAQQAHQQLANRYAQAREAMQAVGTPADLRALDRAHRDAQRAAQAQSSKFKNTKALSTMAGYVGALGAAEQAVEPAPLMKVGTEFTFTNPNIDKLDISSNTGAHFKNAVGLIHAWANAVPGTRIVLDRSANSYLEAPARTERDLNWADKRKLPSDGPRDKCIRFTYTLPSRATWWWQLNVDYQCIETQTDPRTRALMTAKASPDGTAVAAIITNHIFGIAASDTVGARPHATIGGGHLTLDRATTFGDNARWLRNFLVLYANDPTTWAKEDSDVFNAPMIRDLLDPGPAKFKAVIARFDSGQLTTADDLVKALRDEVFVKAHLPKPRTDDEVAANASREKQPVHYESTNLEKWDANDAEGRRLEMRRFDAQTSLADLLKNIDAIIELLKASRVPNLVPLTW